MAEERTEEEQLEALKAWWKRNGTALLLGIGLALAMVFGWQAWERSQVEERMAAAARFQELSAAIEAKADGDEERQSASVSYIADQLRNEHGSSTYAVLGTLLEAGHLVKQGAPAKAVESLQWALDHAGAQPMPLVIRERLARAQFAAGNADEALQTLGAAEDPGVFQGMYKELEGDIHKGQGDIQAAREAYKVAREAYEAEAQSGAVATGAEMLRYKMADLAVSGGN